MLKIPFYKPSIGREEIDEVVETLKSGWLTTGPKTKQFEREFGQYLKQKHAIALNSCTAALHLALEAIGLKAGQGVIVPTMTFAATAEVVRYFGARPILADCRIEDFNLEVADAERKIQSSLAQGQSVAAIMPVHYGGQVGNVADVQVLARRHNLKIVEDAAHCCPAFYRNNGIARKPEPGTKAERDHEHFNGLRRTPNAERAVPSSLRCATRSSPSTSSPSPSAADGWLPVGSRPTSPAFRFTRTKRLPQAKAAWPAPGTTSMPIMRIMALHGISKDAWKRFTAEGSWHYEIIAPGYKYNLTDIAAAIGVHQLRKADAMHRRRAQWAALYSELLADLEELILPSQQPDRIHSWHLYVIRLKLDRLKLDRAQFIAELQQRGIGTSVHWMPLHMHPYYRETYGYSPQALPTACALYPEIITLPLYPDLSEGDVRYVCQSIRDIVCSNRRLALNGKRKPRVKGRLCTDSRL